jgi:hypothetical protein
LLARPKRTRGNHGALYRDHRTLLGGSQPAKPCPIGRKNTELVGSTGKEKISLGLIFVDFSNHRISISTYSKDSSSAGNNSLRAPQKTISLLFLAFFREMMMRSDQGVKMIDADHSRRLHLRKIPRTIGDVPDGSTSWQEGSGRL